MARQSRINWETGTAMGGGDDWPFVVNADATQTFAVAAAGAAAALVTGSGRLVSVLVTTAGTAALLFYDAATSGQVATAKVIGVIPANAAANGVPFVFKLPYNTGLWCASGAGSPAVTVGVA